MVAALLIHAALFGDGTPPPRPTQYALKVHTITLDEQASRRWRSEHAPILSRIERKGPVTAWLVGGSAKTTAADVIAMGSPGIGHSQASSVSAHVGQTCKIVTERPIKYVAHFERIADHPRGQADSVGYRPEVDEVIDALKVELTTRRDDRGCRLSTRIVEDRVVALHQTGESERCRDGRGVGATYQVPELAHLEHQGEWIIPEGQAVVVSLGFRTASRRPAGPQTLLQKLLPAAAPAPCEQLLVIEPKLVTPVVFIRARDVSTAAVFSHFIGAFW